MPKLNLFGTILLFWLIPRVLTADEYFNNFEAEDQACWSQHLSSGSGFNVPGCGDFIEIGHRDSILLSNSVNALSGNKALRISYFNNEDRGQAILPIAGADYVRTTQHLFFNQSYDFAFGEKFHRIYSYNPIADRVNFDIVAVIKGRPLPGLSDRDMSGINDSEELSLRYNGDLVGNLDWGSAASDYINLERERWYQFTTEIQLNQVGQSDGFVRLFMDGSLIAARSGLQIRSSEDHLINSVLFGGWYSNGVLGNPSINPAAPTSFLIDDISVSTSSVPEPGSGTITFAATILFGLRRRRQS